MSKLEKIGLIILFIVSCLYSYCEPKETVENIETVQTITIYVEGMVNETLVFDHQPTIQDVFDKIHIDNQYQFDEDYVLASQSVFYIPKKQSQLISLNSATADQLMTLPGIGEKTAEKIILQREKEQFHTIEDIMEVSGIGEKTYLKLREYLCL